MAPHSVTIGKVVRDTEDDPMTPLVVVALPAPSAEWLTGGTTVAVTNPRYPATAPVVVVVDAAAVDRYLPEWDAETPLSQSALDAAGIYYEAIPVSRITTTRDNAEEASTDTT